MCHFEFLDRNKFSPGCFYLLDFYNKSYTWKLGEKLVLSWIISILLHAPNMCMCLYNISRSRWSLLFVDSISSRRGGKHSCAFETNLLPPPIFFIKIVITSFLFSESLPVIIRISRAFSSAFRSIRHCACERKRRRKRVAMITAGIERFTRQHRALLATGMWHGACVGQCVSNQTMDWISKAEHVWVVRFIHSSGIPPTFPAHPSPSFPLLFIFPLSRVCPPFI